MEIIGISGYARSGKDEFASVLVEEFGFIRIGFADKLREVLYELNPLIAPTPKNYFTNPKDPVLLQDVIKDYGWDGYKETRFKDEIRRLLQRLGTEAGRETLWDSIWVDAAFAGLPEDAKVVVTDTRFPNEAQAIKDKGGKVWRVIRDGVGPINDHPSETSLDKWPFDKWLVNNGTLERWKAYAKNVYETGDRTYVSG